MENVLPFQIEGENRDTMDTMDIMIISTDGLKDILLQNIWRCQLRDLKDAIVKYKFNVYNDIESKREWL